MKGKRKRIGLLIHDTDSEYSMELIKGIELGCQQIGAQLFIFTVGEFNCTWSKSEYQRRAVAFFITKNNIDLMLCASGTQMNNIPVAEFISYLNYFKPLPVISIGVEIPDIPSITIDCTGGLKKLVNHLIDKHNCKRIGIIGVSLKSKDADDRKKVILDTLKERGLKADDSIFIYGKFTYSSVYPNIVKFAEENNGLNFDAFISLNDDMAFAMLDYCKSNGIKVPEDLCLCGFDDISRSSLIQPSLTSINQQITEQGRISVEIAAKMLSGKKVPLSNYVETKVRYRQSCGCVEKDSSINAITDSGTILQNDNTNSMFAALDWHRKKSQLADITEFQMSRLEYASYDLLKKTLNNDCRMFHCSAMSVCLYEPPVEIDDFIHFSMPERVKLFVGYDDKIGFDSSNDEKPIYFNPHDYILPPELMADTDETVTVFSLFQQNVQYGYVVWRSGDFDPCMYRIIARTLSCIFCSAFVNQREENRRQHLEESNMRLMKFSRTDEMTQLLNRRGFMSVGQQSINIAMDIRQTGMVIYGDMDGLKKINDTYGHEAGDRAIKAEAEILSKAFRRTDIIGRLGGDEFAVVALGLSQDIYDKIKDQIEKLCEEWNKTTEEEFVLSISLGATFFDENNVDLDALLKEADAAQYLEKKRKKASRPA
ncbi:MAG: GGDEF domain-containing protein [Spirochaetaceae bacterium]|nr:GGDEF domain-containing protein [Spirochaetaceae bacterium]